MKIHVKVPSQHVIKSQNRNRITALSVLSPGVTLDVLRHAPCALPRRNSLSNHCTGCWGGGGSRADLNGAWKRESFASPGFEAQIHPPIANCHAEYEIPPPSTYFKVTMPLCFPTVTPSFLCRPSLVLEDELPFSFLLYFLLQGFQKRSPAMPICCVFPVWRRARFACASWQEVLHFGI